MSLRKYLKRQVQVTDTELKKTHWAAFVTLTYEDSWLWESRQVSGFLDRVRKYLRRAYGHKDSIRYVWVAEMQKRGVIHYHLVIWIPHGMKLKKPDEAGWWPWGMSNIQKAYSPAGYLGKYLGKAMENLPHRARRFSVQCKGITSMQWYRLPGWLRSLVGIGEHVKYVAGKGWLVRGFYIRSPWMINKYMEITWKGFLDLEKIPGTEVFRGYVRPNRYYSGKYGIWVDSMIGVRPVLA